jgi:rhodanese-related sulfurtransferase
MRTIETLIREQLGTLVDVRTPAEFMGGHAAHSINIPIQELHHRVTELAQLPQPIMVCCASGTRSAQAALFLQQQNLECVNAGSWLDVNYIQSLIV